MNLETQIRNISIQETPITGIQNPYFNKKEIQDILLIEGIFLLAAIGGYISARIKSKYEPVDNRTENMEEDIYYF